MGQQGNNGFYTVTVRGAAYDFLTEEARRLGVTRGEVVNRLIEGRLVEPREAEVFRARCLAERPGSGG